MIQAALASTTRASYLSYFEEWCAFCGNPGKAENPEPDDLLEFLARINERAQSGKTVQAARAAIEAMAAERGWNTEKFHPERVLRFCRGAVRLKPAHPKPPVTFSGIEALRQVKATPCPAALRRARALFLAMLLGPWRLAETLTLRASRIKVLDQRAYCLVQAKEGRGALTWRVLEPARDPAWCPVRAIREMAALSGARGSDFVFGDEKRGPLPIAQARAEIGQYMRRIGMSPYWKPHACRAAGASLMIQANVPMVTVCRLGGWATFEAFWKAYARTFSGERVMEKIEAVVQSSTEHPQAGIIHVSEFPTCDGV